MASGFNHRQTLRAQPSEVVDGVPDQPPEERPAVRRPACAVSPTRHQPVDNVHRHQAKASLSLGVPSAAHAESTSEYVQC
eukprot:831372-Pyramimonas_sp.AAC.1